MYMLLHQSNVTYYIWLLFLQIFYGQQSLRKQKCVLYWTVTDKMKNKTYKPIVSLEAMHIDFIRKQEMVQTQARKPINNTAQN